MRGRGRFAAVLIAGLLAVPLLVACGQEGTRQVGLAKAGDGRFVLMVGVCAGESLSSVAVYNDGMAAPTHAPNPTATPAYDAWRIVATKTAPSTSKVEMFVTPPGWRTDASQLTALLSDQEYGALVGTTAGASGAVKFGPADLDALGSGQVWTRLSGYHDGAVSTAEFQRRSDADCAH